MATTYQGTCGRVPGVRPGANFKEAVCVDTSRVYDSVSDKNCLEDLQVSFPEEAQQVIGSCCSLKLKEVEVENVYMDVEPIPFNKGFYTVDLTFFFSARFEAQLPDGSLVTVCGVTTFTRKMILYGSEGDVKVFCSDQNGTNQNNGMPRVCLQVSTPVALGSRVIDCGSGFRSSCGCNTNCNPCGCNTGCNQTCGCDCGTGCNTGCSTGCSAGCGCLPDGCDPCGPQRQVLITIGIFIIVQMERRVQMLMPAYDFCIPSKEPETPTTGDPCELFKKIKFPTDSFFPPNASELAAPDRGCGCDR